MKVQEIKERFENQEALENTIHIIPYLSIAAKSLLVNDILEYILSYTDDGLLKINFVDKQIAINLALLRYTDIEIDIENYLNDYDILAELNAFSFIKSKVNTDFWILDEIIEDEITQRVELQNGIVSVINRGIGKLIELIDTNTNPKVLQTLIKTLGEEFANLQPEKMGFLTDVLKFNKGIK